MYSIIIYLQISAIYWTRSKTRTYLDGEIILQKSLARSSDNILIIEHVQLSFSQGRDENHA